MVELIATLTARSCVASARNQNQCSSLNQNCLKVFQPWAMMNLYESVSAVCMINTIVARLTFYESLRCFLVVARVSKLNFKDLTQNCIARGTQFCQNNSMYSNIWQSWNTEGMPFSCCFSATCIWAFSRDEMSMSWLQRQSFQSLACSIYFCPK